MKHYLLVIFALMVFGVPAVSSRFGTQVDEIANVFSQGVNQLAAVIISHNPKSVDSIQARYNSPVSSATALGLNNFHNKVRILIVPGHEPGYGGAEYRDLKERNMAVELGQDLQVFLSNDSHYQVFITRDNNQWMPEFATYFKTDWQNIIDWEKASVADMAHQISTGALVKPITTVYHNTARTDVATRLYGITKWANENDIDIMVHIHFNDDTVHPSGQPGKFGGFTIYVPEHQYANSTTTKNLAETVFRRLAVYNPVSNFRAESNGIVEDPDLIAIGAHNTSDAASMLIEYGYIYEQQFTNSDTRSLALKDLAYQTYLGLEDFFDKEKSGTLENIYNTVALPHSWIHPITDSNTQNTDVFALQTAMRIDGEYPPGSESFIDCPRSGKFGPCTQSALTQFQKKYSITGETNIVGEKTLQVLNKNFGAKTI